MSAAVRFHERIVAEIEHVLPVKDLPRLLRWVGSRSSSALWRQEELGQSLADTMERVVTGAAPEADFDQSLGRWIESIRVAKEKSDVSQALFGPRPIWAFWSCYTRYGEPESPLSALLREEVGYPSDEEAGIAVPIGNAAGQGRTRCHACGSSKWWRLRHVDNWVCARCHPPQPPEDEIIIEDRGRAGEVAR
ncbi:MAG: hypothetical protein GY711_24560 [bacterium]|nr:hypothetical protein [bacterium]